MKNKLPGILFLLCMPLSIATFIFVSGKLNSEFLGLVASIFLYILCAILIAFWQNHSKK